MVTSIAEAESGLGEPDDARANFLEELGQLEAEIEALRATRSIIPDSPIEAYDLLISEDSQSSAVLWTSSRTPR